MASSQKVFEKLYAQGAQAAEGAGPEGGAGPEPGADGTDNAGGAADGNSPYGDDVVDGDFKEV